MHPPGKYWAGSGLYQRARSLTLVCCVFLACFCCLVAGDMKAPKIMEWIKEISAGAGSAAKAASEAAKAANAAAKAADEAFKHAKAAGSEANAGAASKEQPAAEKAETPKQPQAAHEQEAPKPGTPKQEAPKQQKQQKAEDKPAPSEVPPVGSNTICTRLAGWRRADICCKLIAAALCPLPRAARQLLLPR